MKKVLTVLLVVILFTVPAFALKGEFGVGFESGYPLSGFTGAYGITDEITTFATFSYDYSKMLDFAVGIDFKVAKFKIEKEKFDFHVGAQIDPKLGLKKASSKFTLAILGTIGVSYDFTIDTDKRDLDFSVLFKAGAGIDYDFFNKKNLGPAFLASLGLIYHI